MSEHLEACLNCATPLAGVWCPKCGQANRRERLDTKDLASDAFDQIVGLDTKVGRTFVDFTLRPGTAALAYVRGHRARYLNPLKYMIFAVALYFLALAGFGLTIGDLGPPTQQPSGGDAIALEVAEAFRSIVNEGMRTMLFASPPIYAWITGFFLGRRRFRLGRDGGLGAWLRDLATAKRRFNFAESCSLWLHLFAHAITIFTLPALCLAAAGYQAAMSWAVVPSMAYYVWSAKVFFGRSWLYTLLIVLLSYGAFVLILIITLVGSTFVAAFLSR